MNVVISTEETPDPVDVQFVYQSLVEFNREKAVHRECFHTHLDTMSFQALPFYQKHGYEVYGVLNDMPSGHQRYF